MPLRGTWPEGPVCLGPLGPEGRCVGPYFNIIFSINIDTNDSYFNINMSGHIIVNSIIFSRNNTNSNIFTNPVTDVTWALGLRPSGPWHYVPVGPPGPKGLGPGGPKGRLD